MIRPLFCLALAALLTIPGLSSPALAQSPEKITVFAAASLTEAFNAAAEEFTAKTRIAVTFSYGGSDTLATQIRQGAPADVFASANVAQMKVVADAGLVAGAPKTFAKNRLVLISPKPSALKFASPADLARPGTKVVLAATTVPVGGYARATFAKLGGTNGYPADFPAMVEKNVVSNELDVKAVVAKIALGEGDAGVVYSTDVTPSVASKLNVLPFPAAVAPDIEYPIAVLRDAPDARAAQAFVDYITSRIGQGFLEARGFVVSGASAETPRQTDIEHRSASVMPFSMDETHHVFTPTANGGTQVVMVMDGDPKQLALVRSHLRKEAAAFAAGNFTDPATLHGASMPGLAMLRHSRGRLDVRYSDIAAGGKISYSSRDARTIAALHQWFAAQVSDHGSHATMKM